MTARSGALAAGVALRLLAFPFAEDLYGDAPVRSDIAQAWARHPGLGWDYGHVLQFGPLPVHLEGLLVWAGVPGMLGARLIPLLFGVLGLVLVGRLAERLGGAEAAAFATGALALSPTHLQASTTCTSEAIYLAFALATVEAVLADRPLALLLAAFGASTTRYDAWLWIPPLAAGLVLAGKRDLPSLGKALALGLGPLSILVANQHAVGDPWAPLRHISLDQAELARQYAAGWPPAAWRLAGVLFWPAASLLALTPVFALVAVSGLRRSPWPLRWVALGPAAIYALRSALTGAFIPMVRMALAPAVLVACAAAPPRRRVAVGGVLVALALDGLLLLAAVVPSPLQEWAERATPVERLPADLRAGVAFLETASGTVAMDQSGRWEDLVIAHHARRDRFALYAPTAPVDRVLAIRGAALDAELRSAGTARGQRCVPAGEVGRISWWDCSPPAAR